MVWTALFLAAVVLPLLSLVIDGTRLFYVRGRLQTAVDAACEDAAWSGADYRAFRDTGATKFIPNLESVLAQALGTFDNTLGDRSQINFTASVSIIPNHAAVSMHCSAVAAVPLTIALGAPVNIQTQAVSAIRFNR